LGTLIALTMGEPLTVPLVIAGGLMAGFYKELNVEV
jgi:hypothetical protein